MDERSQPPPPETGQHKLFGAAAITYAVEHDLAGLSIAFGPEVPDLLRDSPWLSLASAKALDPQIIDALWCDDREGPGSVQPVPTEKYDQLVTHISTVMSGLRMSHFLRVFEPWRERQDPVMIEWSRDKDDGERVEILFDSDLLQVNIGDELSTVADRSIAGYCFIHDIDFVRVGYAREATTEKEEL